MSLTNLYTTLSLVAVLAASPTLAQTGTSSALQEGRDLYEAACAACHGSDGRGRSQAQLGFDIPVPDFTDCDFAAREPDSDWGAIVHEGGPVRGFDRMMPAFGDALDAEEIELVLLRVRAFCLNPDWPRGELNLPRALFTEKAYPEDEAVIEATFVTEGNDSMAYNFIWEQRFGTRNQMEISIPVTRADVGDDGWQSGAGDLAIGVKHVLVHSHENGLIFSLGGEVVLPTGDEAIGFGKGTTVYESYLSLGKLLPRDAFFQVQAIAEFPTDPAVEDELALRAALGKTWAADRGFGRAWTPMIEMVGARERVGGADTQWDLVPQLQVTLNTRQHVMANAGFRVPVTNRSEREVELVLYLLWDWFDGGVLEGW